MKKGQFVLTGVTVTPDVSVAFLKELANGKTVGVKKGAQINGLIVESVEPRRVVLRQGEESEDLHLSVQVPARVAAAPAAPAPPATNLFAPRSAVAGAVPDSSVPAAPGAPQAAGAAAPGTPLPQGASAAQGAPADQPSQPGASAPASGRRRPWINTQ
jgi:hypothetical protein